ncbi:hypothetical protein MVEN_02538000 [Mycena venus]|uniref:Uncharacterized protein n=1 Tax=Mycena venus TaxID=2733690 RepID=A0A8H6U451_9AGAR|nr:hypothetical protein MVEN_02538000 [Mycena venus]
MGSVKLGLLMSWLLAMAGQALSTGGNPDLLFQPGYRASSFDNPETIGQGISTFNYSWQVNFPTGTQVAIAVGDLLDSPGISDTFTVAASSAALWGPLPQERIRELLSLLSSPTSQRPHSTTGVSQPTDNTSPSRTGSGSSHSDIAPIAGGIAGGVTALLLIGLRLWYNWRRRQPSNTILPTATPVFGTHNGATTIGGTAAPIPVTGGVSTQNPVLSQMGYQTDAYDPNKVEVSTGGTSPPPMPTDGSTVSEDPYEQNRPRVPQTIALMVVGGGSGWRDEDDDERRLQNSDELGASSSQTTSSSASPFITPPPREQEREQRLRILESRMSMDMAPPAYNDKD